MLGQRPTHFFIAVEARERSMAALKMLHKLGLLQRILALVATEGDHDEGCVSCLAVNAQTKCLL